MLGAQSRLAALTRCLGGKCVAARPTSLAVAFPFSLSVFSARGVNAEGEVPVFIRSVCMPLSLHLFALEWTPVGPSFGEAAASKFPLRCARASLCWWWKEEDEQDVKCCYLSLRMT